LLKNLLFCSLVGTLLLADDYSSAKVERLIKKGEKIATTLCNDANLSLVGEVDKVIEVLKSTQPCGSLNRKHQEALAYYITSHQESNQTSTEIVVPQDAKCPVCGMFVHKYPKWSALMVIEGEQYYFDGVKDMMKYHIFSADFPYDREKVEQFEVSDFYTLKATLAKEAYYVVGSDVFGPMGDELVPFETEEGAKNFMRDHKGEKIVCFDEIDEKLLMGLDGL